MSFWGASVWKLIWEEIIVYIIHIWFYACLFSLLKLKQFATFNISLTIMVYCLVTNVCSTCLPRQVVTSEAYGLACYHLLDTCKRKLCLCYALIMTSVLVFINCEECYLVSNLSMSVQVLTVRGSVYRLHFWCNYVARCCTGIFSFLDYMNLGENCQKKIIICMISVGQTLLHVNVACLC